MTVVKNAALHSLGPEVESSRTSLASRTHFEVLGLGLEASSPRKLPCPRLENSTIFYTVEILLENARNQRWSPRGRPWPRGHILKSLALALALASRPQVLENWPVLGSRTALFFELLKFCGALEKFSRKRFFVEIA